jgi:hypothetical protein
MEQATKLRANAAIQNLFSREEIVYSLDRDLGTAEIPRGGGIFRDATQRKQKHKRHTKPRLSDRCPPCWRPAESMAACRTAYGDGRQFDG